MLERSFVNVLLDRHTVVDVKQAGLDGVGATGERQVVIGGDIQLLLLTRAGGKLLRIYAGCRAIRRNQANFQFKITIAFHCDAR